MAADDRPGRQVARYLKKGVLGRRAREALGIQTPHLLEGEAEEIERRMGMGPLRAALAEELERLGGDQREAPAAPGSSRSVRTRRSRPRSA